MNLADIKGYYFKNNSEPSQRLSKNPYLATLLAKNKESVLNNKDISGEYPVDSVNSNWHYAIGHFDLKHFKFDNDGNLHFKMYDTYDFNKENKTAINQAARQLMIEGKLKPYFTVHEIMIPKERVKEIF